MFGVAIIWLVRPLTNQKNSIAKRTQKMIIAWWSVTQGGCWPENMSIDFLFQIHCLTPICFDVNFAHHQRCCQCHEQMNGLNPTGYTSKMIYMTQVVNSSCGADWTLFLLFIPLSKNGHHFMLAVGWVFIFMVHALPRGLVVYRRYFIDAVLQCLEAANSGVRRQST